ncbi:diacylglycerol/lipid kinase family protein [Nocardioides aurantiacus]|uniref:diacylglycerol/lipid kinase family protein n=1 Tax=Nocardioides aurantiacus TaxID=86796 RepID=UPI00403F0377
MRSYSFLVNPLSGGGAAPAAVVPVARLLRDAGAAVEVTYSPGPGACVELVRAAVARGDVVVAVGGDGMLASVAGEVADRDGVLGLVPAGRGNDFARTLGLPSDAPGLADTLLHADARPVDLLALTLPGAGPRLVVGSVYAGVDAGAALATYAPSSYDVVVDGRRHTVTAATVVVANSGHYGQGTHVAPDASVTDGLLDVVVVGAATRRQLLTALPRVYRGTHTELDQVTVLRGSVVELGATPAVPAGGDGEPLGTLPERGSATARVEVLPGRLRVLA